MKIGIDIDNVIADSYPAYLNRYNYIFRETVKIDEVLDFYYLNDMAKKRGQKVVNFIDELVIDEEFQLNIPPFTDAVTVIKNWVKIGYGIHYVTARPKEVTKITIAWLKKHKFWHQGVKVDLFDEKSHKSDVAYKRNTALSFHFDVFIEDSLEIARGMKIPVFLIDRPWNQGNLPKNIIRVAHFSDIKGKLAAMSHQYRNVR